MKQIVCYRKKDSLIDSPVARKPVPKAVKTVVKKPDTTRQRRPANIAADTISKHIIQPDTIKNIAVPYVSRKARVPYTTVLRQNPYFNFYARPRNATMIQHSYIAKDGLFYLLVTVLLYFSLIKLVFERYVSNLFMVFFRVSMKQKQIREQLLQDPLPSLLLNIFFVISGGIYASFLLHYYNWVTQTNLWFLMLYSTLVLGVVYTVKYLMLKLTGWIFNIREATDTYAFIVFLVNKLLGVFLLPFLVLLAYCTPAFQGFVVTVSFTMVGLFLAYRYIISFEPVTQEINVNKFHFFLYLCAFEIIPLLLIYKVLLNFLERST